MADYTLSDLEALTGLPARTIRYYIAQGLIPSPGREGPSSRYPEQTLQRLRLIARLRDAHLPLAAIRTRLASLHEDSIASLSEAPASPQQPAEPASALDYIRSLLAGQAGSGAISARSATLPAPSALSAPSAPPVPSAPPGASAPSVPVAPAAQARMSRLTHARRSIGPTGLNESPGPLLSQVADTPAAYDLPVPSAPIPSAPPPPASSAPIATASQSITPPQPPSLGERSQWERIAITTDIELHVRRPLTRPDNRLVERLIAFARQLQEDTK